MHRAYNDLEGIPRSIVTVLETAEQTATWNNGPIFLKHRTAGHRPAGSCAFIQEHETWIVGRTIGGVEHTRAFKDENTAREQFALSVKRDAENKEILARIGQ